MKNQTIKKLLGLTLALTMLGSTLVGCGNQPTNKESEPASSSQVSTEESKETPTAEPTPELEPVTLKWYHEDAEKEGSADVFKVFNEKLAEVLPNTTVEFVTVPEYKNNWPVLMAGGEEIDIAWVGLRTPYYQDVLDGNIMGISDLIEEYAPNLVKDMETYKGDWMSCTLDGEIYGVPCAQPVVRGVNRIMYSETLAPYMDLDGLLAELDDPSEKLTEKMLDIIEAAFAGAIEDGKLKKGDTSWKLGSEFPNLGAIGYEPIQEGARYYIDPQAEDPELLYFWEIPEVKMCVERVAEWYEKGWVTETEVLGQMPSDSLQQFWIEINGKATWAKRDERGLLAGGIMQGVTPIVDIATNKVEDGYKPASVFGSSSTYLAIPYTSENPERAIMLLNILYDEPGTVGNELVNLLCYGFEKNSPEAKEYGWFNYEATEDAEGQLVVNGNARGTDADGKVLPAKHSMTNWKMGNTYKIMSNNGPNYTVTQKEYSEKFWSELYPGMKESAISEMFIDTGVVSEELENINVVFKEYSARIFMGCGGTDKVDAVMEEALAKLNEAGWGTVKKEIEAQIDAYNAAK